MAAGISMAVIDHSTGVIVVPPFDNLHSKSVNLSFAEYDAKLLFFQLYFDKILSCPININAGGMGFQSSTLLEQVLVRRGLMRLAYPPVIRQNGPWDAELLAGVTKEIFEGVRGFEGGHWALAAPPEVEPHFEGDDVTSLVMTLRRVLPCPRPDRPLDDLVAFKQAHAEELNRLRHAINKMALAFQSDRFHAEALSVLQTELSSAVTAVRRAHEADRIPYFTPDLSISWALPRVVIAGVAEWIAQHYGLPSGSGAIAASGVTFNVGKSRLASESNSAPKDFSYLLSGVRESLIEAFPDDDPLSHDIEHLVFTNNVAACSYPAELTAPVSRKGGFIGSSIFL